MGCLQSTFVMKCRIRICSDIAVCKENPFVKQALTPAAKLPIALTVLSFSLLGVWPSWADPILIGAEASLQLTNSALWRGYIGNAPADQSLQSVNPPVFRWTYMENPQDSALNCLRTFRFQVSRSQTFATPAVNVVTSNNFYNFIAPFTNADGSTYTGSNYWRIIYMNSNASINVATSAVRSFRLGAASMNWDRSSLARHSSLISATAEHPHMMFRENDRSDVLRWCQTSQWSAAWITISNRAFQTITQAWWSTPQATNKYDFPLLTTEVAFVYQLTRNGTLLQADPMAKASLYATHFLRRNYDRSDPASIHQVGSRCLPLLYDWLYHHMTTTQRSNILFCLESQCRFYLYSFWWYNASATDINRAYVGPYGMNRASASRLGSSHPKGSLFYGLSACLGAMGESPFLRTFFDYAANYVIGQFEPYTEDGGPINQGRGYLSTIPPHITRTIIPLAITFPQVQLHKHPLFKGIARWLMCFEPVNFSQINEPWGDLGSGRPLLWQGHDMANVALFAHDGEAYQHHINAYKVKDRYVAPRDLFELLIPFYYPPPDPKTASTTCFVNPDGGWFISSSEPPNTFETFTNGVGFITHARPRGTEVNHSKFSDGDIQMWAYGASVTDSGCGSYKKHPMYHNTLLVDGIGMCLPQLPMHDWYSRLIGWQDHDRYSYVAMDITRAYNRSNFTVGGYGLNSAFASFYTTNKVPYVSQVQRHILFPRKQYLVIYDDLRTSRPATFTWKWNVLEPTMSVNTGACAFEYTATNHYSDTKVRVVVQHVVNPHAMTIIGLKGTNTARSNPITREDYGATDGDTYARWNGTVWVSNAEKSTDWHFLSVVYPYAPEPRRVATVASGGQARAPGQVKGAKNMDAERFIKRLDDYTVEVRNGMENDIIRFDPGNVQLAPLNNEQLTNAIIVHIPSIVGGK